MSNGCFAAQKLPDIEIYGGDTTPWEIVLMRDNNTIFDYTSGEQCSVILTVTQSKTSTGQSAGAVLVAPIFTKHGAIQSTATGGTIAIFSFADVDTKHLRGKYTYQIEVQFENELRIGQGSLYVKQNMNR